MLAHEDRETSFPRENGSQLYVLEGPSAALRVAYLAAIEEITRGLVK